MEQFLQSYRRTIRTELESDFEYALSELPHDSSMEDLLELLAKCDVTRYANHYAQYVLHSSHSRMINLSDSESFRDHYCNIRDSILVDIMTNYVNRTQNVYHIHMLSDYLHCYRKEQSCK